jgi:hypothetical protein
MQPTRSVQGYKQFEPEYTKEQNAVQKLQKWVMQTVAPAYKSTCCVPGEQLWKWHDNLQKRCGQSKADELLETRSAYKNSLKPPRNLKDASNWVDKWETAMAKISFSKTTQNKLAIEEMVFGFGYHGYWRGFHNIEHMCTLHRCFLINVPSFHYFQAL